MVISIHSFTPQLNQGEIREVDIGLLVKQDFETMDKFNQCAKAGYPELRVRVNEPYSAFDLNYTIDNIANLGRRHLSIEVNQALLKTDQQAQNMASKIADCLSKIL